jgi:drug/metabolite transporter (DMT)-like permease
MKKILKIGPLFVVIAALLWSADGILRRSLFTLPPSTIVFWEHVLGLIVLSPFFITRRQEIAKLTKKEWVAMGFVALFSGALGTIAYTSALGRVQYIQFSVVVLLQQLQPIWAIITAAILLREKITKDFLGWAALAIVASYFVTFRDLRLNLDTGSGTLMAALLALLAGVMWATSTSFSKIVLHKVSHYTATLLRFALAPLFALILVALFHQTPTLFAVTPSQWTTLILITFSTGMVALLIYYFGLKKTPVKVATIAELVWPASAIFIDYIYFKQTLSATQIAGVIVLLYAIFRVSKFRK